MFKKYSHFLLPFFLFFTVGFRSCDSTLSLGYPTVITTLDPIEHKIQNLDINAFFINLLFLSLLIFIFVLMHWSQFLEKNKTLRLGVLMSSLLLIWSSSIRFIIALLGLLASKNFYLHTVQYLHYLDPLSFLVVLLYMLSPVAFRRLFLNLDSKLFLYHDQDDLLFRVLLSVSFLICFLICFGISYLWLRRKR